ncbi:ABC transporter permease [Pseudonocardia sp. NPDC049635]|uniref:ABC transporter permease n=1 Tax=Pseudonocardia sp. NPDC049635 TaxID=3155506 RepID=UPI0033EB48F3
MLIALWPELIASQDPTLAQPRERLLPPSAEHLFGTDSIGRDQFARVAHGTLPSLRAGLIAVSIGLVGGGLLGLVSGFSRGPLDLAIARLCDALLAIPGLLMALAFLTAIGSGVTVAACAIGIAQMPVFARVMRAEVKRVSALPYTEAAAAAGVGPVATAVRHVLPNSWGPVLALAALECGQAILILSSLSYLGFGEPPPAPEWGALIAAGQSYLAVQWWLAVLPGVVLAAMVIAITRLGHAARRNDR